MDVTVIAGPPCAGKTTYAREHMTPGDLLLDNDLLYQALSGAALYERPQGNAEGAPYTLWPFVWAAYNGVLRKVYKSPGPHKAWVISSAPRWEQRDDYRRVYMATVIMLDVPAAVCHERARARFGEGDRLTEYIDVIDQWWTAYVPSNRDICMTNA